jgi:hypothetical protein
MKLHHHTAFSITIAGILYMIFKSWGLAIACLVSGIFIDLDHIIDYIREHGWPFKIKDFFQVHHKCQFNQIVLVWHGWEWIILWAAAAWLTGWNPWMTGALIGMSQHMLLDTLYNTSNLFTYSFIWRWKQNFDFDTIFTKKTRNKYKYKTAFSDETQNN